MIQNVMRNYFKEPITGNKILRDKERLVAEVEVDGKTFYLKGEKQSAAFVEKMIGFIDMMRNAKLPFSMSKLTLDGKPYVEHDGLIFILEEKGKGKPMEALRLKHIQEIGAMLGKQHAASMRSAFSFGRGTSWGMFGGNETEELGDYDENELCYWDLVSAVEDKYEKEMSLIQELYKKRRAVLQAEWAALPKGAVQGDLLPYNLLFQQDRISAIFDFDIAGDEVLVNECVGNAIFLAWHHEFEGLESPKERYDAYMDAYYSERPLSNCEKEMIPHLFAIIRAFRYDRIEEGIEKMKSGKGKSFLNESIMLLS